MTQATTTDTLNRLLAITCRSFPMYLTYARPWLRQGTEQIAETLEHIVADQRALAERISEAIVDGDACPDTGEFPMEFTDLHDLSAEFIVRMAIEYQKRDVTAIEQVVDQLRLAPAALPLAEEALGMAKGHLESLEELVPQPA